MKNQKLVLFALGGNEIAPIVMDKSTGAMINPDLPAQWKQAWKSCEKLADFITANPDRHYLLTHGNGPQIGNILLRSEYAGGLLHKLPLDVCGADSQGALGYMLAQLSNSLQVRDLDIKTAEIVTQVIVDSRDPAFEDPTKFIGPALTRTEAEQHAAENGYLYKYYKLNENREEIWRRVVPSPKPVDIVEIDIIESVYLSGNIPIAVGGGGIPVVQVEPGSEGEEEVYRCNYGILYRRPKTTTGNSNLRILKGIEGVVDKDLASSLLARKIMERAEKRGEFLDVYLVILTDVDGVKLNFQQPEQQDIRHLTLEETEKLHAQGIFPSGSMGPKIEAVINFLRSGGRKAYITNIDLLDDTFSGKAGTEFVPN